MFSVKPKYQIPVEKGDFIGFHYSVNSKQGAIAVLQNSANSTSRDVNMHYTITAGLFDENFLVNVPINFNTNDRQVRHQRHALAAVVKSHGRDGK